MSTIIEVHAREILDSRGNPTVETDVVLSSGAQGRAAVPSGASTGEHEAVELRDGDPKRYVGKGVTEAVRNVNEVLGPRLEGMAAADQIAVDAEMMDADGTPNKSKLGANAILSVSLAVARAAAQDCGLPLYRYLGGPMARVLPVPMMNILNGGAHASNNVDAQEFMVVPIGAETLRRGTAHRRRGVPRAQEGAGQDGPLHRRGRRGRLRADAAVQRGRARRGDAGDRERGLRAGPGRGDRARRGRVGAVPGWRVRLQEGRQQPAAGRGDGGSLRRLGGPLSDRLDRGRPGGERLGRAGRGSPSGCTTGSSSSATICSSPTWTGWGGASRRASANAVLVKVNQIGTLTETLQCIELAKGSAYGVVISHRSGETEDTFIADLAVATGAGQIKTGSASRTDRTAKYNQLLRIAEELGDLAHYPGRDLYPL